MNFLIFLSDQYKLLFIVILIFFFSFIPLPFHTLHHNFINGAFAIIFLSVFLRQRSPIFTRVDILLWFFLIAIGLNVFFAQQKNIAVSTYKDLALPMIAIYYLMSTLEKKEEAFDIVAMTMTLCGFIVALLAFCESIFAYNPLYENFIVNPYYQYYHHVGRPVSTQFNPIPLGTYLLGSLPFCFYVLYNKKNLLRFLGGLSASLVIVMIIGVYSRGAYLSFIGMGLFYLFVKKRFRLLIAFLVAMILLSVLCSFLPYPFTKIGIPCFVWTNDGLLSSYRFDRIEMIWKIVRDHPFVGLGLQHLRLRFFEYYPHSIQVPYIFRIADNMYLTLLAETGFVGFAGFSLFILYSVKMGLSQLKDHIFSAEVRSKTLVTLCSLIGFLIHMSAYELLYWSNQYLFFCVVVSLLASLARSENFSRTS